jgi:uncharacterized protein (TIGR03437 family)
MRLALGIFSLLLASICWGQTVTAVVDAASSTADVSPGALATIYGSNLSTGTASSSNYPTSLGGVTVTINGYAAPLLYVTPGQINLQIPYEVEPGSATAIVTSDGYQSNDFSFDVFTAAPGIFVDSNQNSITQNSDGSVNNQHNPAAPGSVVVVYLTGIGPLDNPIGTGQVSPSSPLSRTDSSFSATLGGQSVQILYLGLTPGFLGLAQANIVVPNIADGDYPLVITIAGSASNSPYLAVAADGVDNLQRKINARPRKK